MQGYGPQQSPAPALPAQAAMNYVGQGSPYSTQAKLVAAQNNIYPQQQGYNSPGWGYDKTNQTAVASHQQQQQQQYHQHPQQQQQEQLPPQLQEMQEQLPPQLHLQGSQHHHQQPEETPPQVTLLPQKQPLPQQQQHQEEPSPRQPVFHQSYTSNHEYNNSALPPPAKVKEEKVMPELKGEEPLFSTSQKVKPSKVPKTESAIKSPVKENKRSAQANNRSVDVFIRFIYYINSLNVPHKSYQIRSATTSSISFCAWLNLLMFSLWIHSIEMNFCCFWRRFLIS